MYSEIVNILKISREFIEINVKEGNTVVDCTVGNGNDTEILLKAIGSSGKLIGFDIQKDAILSTKERLTTKGYSLDNVDLINDGHENIDRYISEADLFIYNLGYLPKGDKDIITKGNTTVKSLEKAIEILKPEGFILVSSYIGHDGGMEENRLIEKFLCNLDQKKFNILKNSFINQKNNPPILYILEKNSEKNIK